MYTLRNTRSVLLAALLVVLTATTAVAADKAPQQVVENLQQTYPKLEFQRVYTSPIAGLYEVVAGNKILYFAPASGHMLAGDLWSKDGQNLSKARIGEIMGEKLKDLPMDKAVKIGTGKNVVIEVTDPDCPFCRKGSEYFAGRPDVTRYVFFFPLKMHPDAEKKVAYILSAEHPETAYEEVMSGRYDNQPLPPFTDNGLINVHKAAVELLGLSGTPNYWINGTYVSGANINVIEQLLK